jgi:hypothetical protein
MSDPVLAPIEKTLTLGGKRLTVRPLKVRQIPAFSEVIGPIYAELAKEGEPDWFGLMACQGENLIKALSLGFNLSHEEMEDLDLAELVEALLALMEVNIHFFIHRLSPQITQASQALIALRGQMDSSGLLPMDTATPSSSTTPSVKSKPS